MQKVTNVESSSNTLAQAREKVTKLMNNNKEGKYDFDERLQRAKEEIWEAEQEALTKNANGQQDILSYVELYSLKCTINSIDNNLSALTQ